MSDKEIPDAENYISKSILHTFPEFDVAIVFILKRMSSHNIKPYTVSINVE